MIQKAEKPLNGSSAFYVFVTENGKIKYESY